MLQLLSFPAAKCSSAINRIFYLSERSQPSESANITSLVLSILLSLKRPYRYLQIVELENCWTCNFLKFCLLIYFEGATLTNLALNMLLWPYSTFFGLILYHHRLCITAKLSDVQCCFFKFVYS